MRRRSWDGRSSTLPIWFHVVRSRLWKIGAPGYYLKLEQARN
ncbi:hypothetical protein [Microbispora hainanensis]